MAGMTQNDGWIDPPTGAKPVDDGWIDPPTQPQTIQPESEKPSGLEAFGRGAAQGATLGFSDELVGLGHALFADRDYAGSEYRKARDREREANHAAEAAHPWAYGGGNLAGGVATSFVPGLGIAKGAGVLKTALGAAKLGAFQGLGESESEDVGGMAFDALKSGALAGTTAGVLQHVVGNAPERVIQRRIGDVTDGATATMRDRLVGQAGKNKFDVLDVLRDKPFRQAGRDPEKLLGATELALQQTGQKLDEAYARAGLKTPGIKVSDVLGEVENIAKRLEKDPGKADLARAVQAKAEDVFSVWGNRTHVPAQDVRILASDIADTAFRGSPAIAPKAGQSVSREVWRSLKDLIDKNVEQAGRGGSSELAALNKRMSTLINIRDAVAYRATRGATQSTRLRDVAHSALDLGLASTSLPAFAAKKSMQYVGAPVARALDERLAGIVQLAARGVPSAQIAERAVVLGFSPTVSAALAAWAQNQAAELDRGIEAQ